MDSANTPIKMPDLYAQMFFATQAHLGGSKVSCGMESYVYGKRHDGISVFDLEKTWEKLVLAARVICGRKVSETICTVSGKTFGRKPVLKFAESIKCKGITSRFVPGSFTNTTVKGSLEPTILIVSDPSFDKQAIHEATMVNCPVIAFCNTDANLSNIDVAIPINNRSPKAIGAAFFALSKLVNFMKNGEKLEENMKNVELFFFRDSVELDRLLSENESENKIQFGSAVSQGDDVDFGRSTVEAEAGSNWTD